MIVKNLENMNLFEMRLESMASDLAFKDGMPKNTFLLKHIIGASGQIIKTSACTNKEMGFDNHGKLKCDCETCSSISEYLTSFLTRAVQSIKRKYRNKGIDICKK